MIFLFLMRFSVIFRVPLRSIDDWVIQKKHFLHASVRNFPETFLTPQIFQNNIFERRAVYPSQFNAPFSLMNQMNCWMFDENLGIPLIDRM